MQYFSLSAMRVAGLNTDPPWRIRLCITDILLVLYGLNDTLSQLKGQVHCMSLTMTLPLVFYAHYTYCTSLTPSLGW